MGMAGGGVGVVVSGLGRGSVAMYRGPREKWGLAPCRSQVAAPKKDIETLVWLLGTGPKSADNMEQATREAIQQLGG